MASLTLCVFNCTEKEAARKDVIIQKGETILVSFLYNMEINLLMKSRALRKCNEFNTKS